MLTEKDLQTELSKVVKLKSNKFWYAYHLKSMQRFLMHTLMAFFVQYFSIIHLALAYPMLSIHPPIGSSLALFYLLGENAWGGIFLGGLCAYGLHGLSISFVVLYVLADIACGYWGAYYCRTLFSSDWSVFTSTRDWYKFIKTIFIPCLFSSALRMSAVLLNTPHPVSTKLFFYEALNFWVADLNAVIVYAAFVLTWISVYLKQEKISHRAIAKKTLIGLVGLIISSFLWNKNPNINILLVVCTALYLAYCYGFLIASLSAYILTMLFFVLL